MTSAVLDDARATIASAGGVASSADLARRWCISRAHAHRLTHEPTFPAPDGVVNGNPVWLVTAADTWYFDPVRALRRSR